MNRRIRCYIKAFVFCHRGISIMDWRVFHFAHVSMPFRIKEARHEF